jgi:multidrug efflux pump subunit AcrA (membrane-fusion protein)
MTFEERIETSGNLETKHYALVSARLPGVIDEVYVEEGNYVQAGKTKLFQTDKIKLNQAAQIAKQSVAVADFTHRARMATVTRVEADYNKARLDYERFRRLYENGETVSKDALESQKLRFEQVKASLEEARAGADLAQHQMKQAQTRLLMAQKDLNDSLVRAPINGHISVRYCEPGEMAAAGTPIVRIDDLSVLEISAYLPAQYYARVIQGRTKMRALINGITFGELPVTYRSPTIDNRLRNFKVKAVLENPPEGIAPGAMAKIQMIMDRRDSMSVPRKAVLQRKNGQVIFLAEEGKAKMVQLETGLEMDGWIEVLAPDLREGCSVIAMGQDQLNDGSLISILREDKE